MNCLKKVFKMVVIFWILIFCYYFLNYNVFADEDIWYKGDNDPLRDDMGFDCDNMGKIIYNYYDEDALAISMSQFQVDGRNWGWGEEPPSEERINQYMKLGDEAHSYGLLRPNECDYYAIVTEYHKDGSYNTEYNTMRQQAKNLITLYQKRANATAKEKVQAPDGNIIGDSKGDIEKISKGDTLILTLEYGNELLDFINVTVKKDGVEVYNSNKTNKFEYTFSEKGKYHIEYNYSYLYAARYTEYECAGSCTYESGKKLDRHMEYQLGFMWEIETYDIEIDEVANVSLNKHIAYITDESDWIELDDISNGNPAGYLHSQQVYNTNNEQGHRWRSNGKKYSAVADVGDYVYFLIEVENKEEHQDAITIIDTFDGYTGSFQYRKWKSGTNAWGPLHTSDDDGNTTYGSDNKIKIVSDIGAGQYEKIYVRVQMTSGNMSNLYNSHTNTATISKVTLVGKTEELKNKSSQISGSDTVLCRKYDVSVDMYIASVNSSQPNYELGYRDSRVSKTDTYKHDTNPVYVEKGDYIQIEAIVTNNVHINSPVYSGGAGTIDAWVTLQFPSRN